MKILIIALFTALFVSCSTVPTIPDGAPFALVYSKKKSEWRNPDNLTIHLASVDGNKVGAARSVRLSPDRHTLEFSYYQSRGGIVGYTVGGIGKITVSLKNGGVYRFEGKGHQEHGVVKLIETRSSQVVFSKKFPYQHPNNNTNDTFLQDFTNQMMIPYNTGVY